MSAEQAYKSWLIAAKDAAQAIEAASGGVEGGGWAALGRYISRTYPKSLTDQAAQINDPVRRAALVGKANEIREATQNWQVNRFNTVNGWARNGKVPGGIIRPALIEVVAILVPNPPHDVGDWKDFSKLVATIVVGRTSPATIGEHAQKRGRKIRLGEVTKLLATGQITTVTDMDPLQVNLGSGVYNGALPPYVTRDADQTLTGHINSGARFVVVAGPPKSGKSRSVYQTLVEKKPDQQLLWLPGGPGNLQTLIKALERVNNLEPVILVIDDLQRCGIDPSQGLTETVLDQLVAKTSLIIATIHDNVLTAWENQTKDQRVPDPFQGQLGVTTALINRLNQHRVDYQSTLTEDEYAAAAHVLVHDGTSTGPEEFINQLPRNTNRLAEYFAAVEALHRRALHGRRNDTYQKGILAAAIDADIIYPGGVTRKQLKQLTRIHHANENPTQLWNPDLYQTALDWATTPIGGSGSPHAILQANHHENTYHIIDTLPPLLQTRPWTSTHLINQKLPSHALFHLGLHHQNHNQPDEARYWWNQAANHNLPEAMFNLGVLEYEAGDTDQARYWYTQAANQGDTGAMYTLGILEETHNVGMARYWYTQAANQGDTNAMNNLGNLLYLDQKTDPARDWYERAANLGSVEALFNLGALEHLLGRSGRARHCYTQAASRGSVEAMNNLGVIEHEAGNLVQASHWFTRSAACGETGAMFNLGGLEKKAGDTDKARYWWTKAAEQGQLEAIEKLNELNDTDGSEQKEDHGE